MALSFSPLTKQTWIISGVLFVGIEQGIMVGHPSSLVNAMKDPNSPIKADLSTISWVVSSYGWVFTIGLVLCSIFMDWCGRRRTFLVTIVPSIIGWLTIYFANNVTALIIGRMLGGLTAGGSMCLGSAIIGEFTAPKYRGIFLTMKTASIPFGTMIAHILGNFFHWKNIALFALIPSIISFGIVITWPETPSWLASKKKFKECEEVFTWIRGTGDQESQEIKKLINAQKEIPNKALNFFQHTLGFFQKFTKKNFIKPCINIFFAVVVLESGGRHYFPAYAPQIIADIIGTSSQSFYYILFLDLIITSSMLFSTILVKVMNRRTLLFSTGISSLFFLTVVIIYMYLVSIDILSKHRVWIPICLYIIVFILVNLGCTIMAMTWNGELFPLVHRSAGCIVFGFFMNMGIIVVSKVSPYLIERVKVYGMFAVYGLAVGISLVVLYFTAPETKDRTLQEIEYYFNNGRFEERYSKSNYDEEAKIINRCPEQPLACFND